MESRSLGQGRVSVPVIGARHLAAAGGRCRGLPARVKLIEAAIAAGIRLVDTSPMYGAAERLLSDAPDGHRGQVFIADKVWTPSAQEGMAQLSRAVNWYGGHVDLMQIHNLAGWHAHLPMLEAARDREQVGLIGATHDSPAAFGVLAEAHGHGPH